MRLRDLVQNLEGVEVRPGTGPAGGPDAAVTGLSADSRDIAPGFVFAAIPGTQMDGARFIPDAVAQGAVAILCTPAAAEAVPDDLTRIVSAEPRAALAHLAARVFPGQPEVICAVTGTNGKTSVASFLCQIWQADGKAVASIGTLGVVTAKETKPLGHTTPDPVILHHALDELATDGVTHLAMEASSHGLAQHRLDGVRVAAGALTNLSRDHLDYHADFDDYLAAKLRLFTDIVASDGAAVLNADEDCFDAAREAAEARGLRILSVGTKGQDMRLVSAAPRAAGLHLTIEADGQAREINLPLVGAFQASNALVAAGLALATGTALDVTLSALEHIEGAEGRMQLVLTTGAGAAVLVDYAHTPDALATALAALRPHTEGRLHVVFGAGGDRDRGKRPLMGKVAREGADVVIVTDDNPRSEAPADIRAEIVSAVPEATEIGDRRAAIDHALRGLEKGDTLLVAGKGHESGQTIKGVTHPFKDANVIRELMKEEAHS